MAATSPAARSSGGGARVILAYAHHYGGHGGGGILGMVVHLVIASAVWHLVARLPAAVQLGLAAGGVALLLVTRRRSRFRSRAR